MPSHGNYYLSLLSVSQLSTPTLSPTVSESADSRRDSWKKTRNCCFPAGLGRLDDTVG